MCTLSASVFTLTPELSSSSSAADDRFLPRGHPSEVGRESPSLFGTIALEEPWTLLLMLPSLTVFIWYFSSMLICSDLFPESSFSHLDTKISTCRTLVFPKDAIRHSTQASTNLHRNQLRSSVLADTCTSNDDLGTKATTTTKTLCPLKVVPLCSHYLFFFLLTSLAKIGATCFHPRKTRSPRITASSPGTRFDTIFPGWKTKLKNFPLCFHHTHGSSTLFSSSVRLPFADPRLLKDERRLKSTCDPRRSLARV